MHSKVYLLVYYCVVMKSIVVYEVGNLICQHDFVYCNFNV